MTPHGYGKIRVEKDKRNYSMKHPKVVDYFIENEILLKAEAPILLPTSVDNRHLCSPIKHQGILGSCVAFATVAMLEYFENLNYDTYVNASDLYVYYKIDHKPPSSKDCSGGSSIYDGMQELKNIGVPPNICYPYQTTCPLPSPSKCDNEASKYRSNSYVDLSQGINSQQQLINNIKANIVQRNAVIAGFYVFNENYIESTGEWYMPCSNDKITYGHAVLIVGYDNNKTIKSPRCNISSTGAFIIKNSWGTSWGINGFGWLPYNYFLNNTVSDECFTITGITTPITRSCTKVICNFSIR